MTNCVNWLLRAFSTLLPLVVLTGCASVTVPMDKDVLAKLRSANVVNVLAQDGLMVKAEAPKDVEGIAMALATHGSLYARVETAHRIVQEEEKRRQVEADKRIHGLRKASAEFRSYQHDVISRTFSSLAWPTTGEVHHLAADVTVEQLYPYIGDTDAIWTVFTTYGITPDFGVLYMQSVVKLWDGKGDQPDYVGYFEYQTERVAGPDEAATLSLWTGDNGTKLTNTLHDGMEEIGRMIKAEIDGLRSNTTNTGASRTINYANVGSKQDTQLNVKAVGQHGMLIWVRSENGVLVALPRSRLVSP